MGVAGEVWPRGELNSLLSRQYCMTNPMIVLRIVGGHVLYPNPVNVNEAS